MAGCNYTCESQFCTTFISSAVYVARSEPPTQKLQKSTQHLRNSELFE